MPRVRLTDEERAAKKKERWRKINSGEAYAKYDDRLGRGSAEEWAKTAEAFVNGNTTLLIPANDDLMLLGLDAIPETKKLLYRAYRKTARTAHPDSGGSDAAFIAVKAAYERLLEKMGWK